MNRISDRPADNIETIVEIYGSMLFRICLVMLRNAGDAEDVVQETFLKCVQNRRPFDSDEHMKAWLITVATNKCRDMLRFRIRHPQTDIEAVQAYVTEPEDMGVLDALLALPEKYRLVLMLHYVEGYRVDEIAGMIGRTPSAVKMRLQKGRKLLEEKYQEEYM